MCYNIIVLRKIKVRLRFPCSKTVCNLIRKSNPDATAYNYRAMLLQLLLRRISMKIQQLEYVIAIAQEGSITHAAKKLFQAQPNISIALKELETELGIQIFSRTSNGMVLTPEGEKFLSKATSIVNDIHSLERDYLTRNCSDISMNIGVCRSGYVTSIMGEFISKYAEECDRMDIHLVETDTISVMNDTCTGKFDVGVMRIPESYVEMFNERINSRKLISQTLCEYRLGVCIPATHPLAKYDDIPYEELRQYPEIYNGTSDPEMMRRAMLSMDYDDSQAIKRIYVYDRGSQISLLTTVKDSFMWIPPIQNKFLESSGLIIKKCSLAKHLNKDIIIYRKSSENNTLVTECVESLMACSKKVQNQFDNNGL